MASEAARLAWSRSRAPTTFSKNMVRLQLALTLCSWTYLTSGIPMMASCAAA